MSDEMASPRVTISDVTFDERGLVPAIIQDAESARVLMLGYMNAVSLEETLATGRVVFWSRSRSEIWRKGETSGHIQRVHGVELDCDGDALLVQVHQTGGACHTGAYSCFDRGRFAETPLVREESS